ncbi:MAG TPA: kynureninase [Patescibacteria group bacterium]|nr:kynureninase [Patescibacteria group bacterium]
MDVEDPLSAFRARFHVPDGPDGRAAIYFCGNSLGLMPKAARALVDEEMDDWAALAVDGHFAGRRPWLSYHERLRDGGARLVGARPGEVVMMNTLTVNLHLLMATFYRPTAERHAILIEEGAFPSDMYAAESQVRHHGLRPESSLILARPRDGEATLRTGDLERLIEERGRSIALVLLPGVQYFTGQVFDLARLTAAAHRQGCRVGFDLAHAAGNVPLRLHDDEVDFAVWCSYKYLNAGPGAVAGCFVHERHGADATLPRLAGWWGTDPATRFQMKPEFLPRAGADGWQVSNPPILSLAPLVASLAIFDAAGVEALRVRSVRMTAYLQAHLDRIAASRAASGRLETITPRGSEERGCQISLRVHGGASGLQRRLHAAGVVCDLREPDVLRVAPVPLYNTFHEIWRFAGILAAQAA